MNPAHKHRLASRRYTRNSKLLRYAVLAVFALAAFPLAAFLGNLGDVGGHVSHSLMLPAVGALTLTFNEILRLQIQAFRKRVPALATMGTDFGEMSLRYNQTGIARIRTLPTASTYGTSGTSGGISGTGYANGVQSARSLLTDVSLTLDQWGTVPLLLEHINHIQDVVNDYTGVVADGGYVLGKQIVDFALKKVNFSHFSQSTTFSVANCDVDMLVQVNQNMNQVNEANDRYMLVNSAVASVLAVDQRLINSQWFGEKQGSETVRVWRNAFGFKEIREYVDLPSGTVTPFAFTGVSATGVLTQTAHGLSVGDRWQATTLTTGGSGLTAGAYYYVLTVPTVNTFTISATRGGSVQALGSDVSSATGGRATNLVAFAYEKRAFAIKSGAPAGITQELAAQFGVPLNTALDSMYDPDTQTAMGMARFQLPATGDLYVVPTVIYGARAGQDISMANGTSCDYAGNLIISA